MLNEVIYTPGHVQEETINVAGVLNKTVNLTPFNVDPNDARPAVPPGRRLRRHHLRRARRRRDPRRLGRRRDDRGRGARRRYAPNYVTPQHGRRPTASPCDRAGPHRLRPPGQPGRRPALQPRRHRRLALRPHPPRRRVRPLRRVRAAPRDPVRRRPERSGPAPPTRRAVTPAPAAARSPPTRTSSSSTTSATRARSSSAASRSPPTATASARGSPTATATTSLFGDLGNDWIVGGTGHDTLWGGWGNDLLQADDDLSGCPPTTRTADLHVSRRLLAQRHARHAPDLRGPRLRRRRARRPHRQHRRRPPDRLGRRVQQLHRAVRAVRHRDRQPPGAAGAVRVPLRALGRQGADPTRAADTTLDLADRNGEPYGEIGLITQQDHGLWQDQTGAPADPQAGNIPGGKRDVLRSANFNDGRHARLRHRQRGVGGHRRRRCRSRRPRSARTPPRSSTSTRPCPSTTSCSPR